MTTDDIRGVDGIPITCLDVPGRCQSTEPRLLERDVPAVLDYSSVKQCNSLPPLRKKTTYIDMNHNLRLRHSRSNSITDALSRPSPQRRQLREVLRSSTGGLRVDIDITRRPQHPMPNLIAQAHNPHLHARITKLLQRARHICPQGLRQRLKGCGPRGRNGLLGRIGPVVAKVEVEVDGVTLGVEFLGERESVVEAVVAGICAVSVAGGGVDPEAEADGVHAWDGRSAESKGGWWIM